MKKFLDVVAFLIVGAVIALIVYDLVQFFIMGGVHALIFVGLLGAVCVAVWAIARVSSGLDK